MFMSKSRWLLPLLTISSTLVAAGSTCGPDHLSSVISDTAFRDGKTKDVLAALVDELCGTGDNKYCSASSCSMDISVGSIIASLKFSESSIIQKSGSDFGQCKAILNEILDNCVASGKHTKGSAFAGNFDYEITLSKPPQIQQQVIYLPPDEADDDDYGGGEQCDIGKALTGDCSKISVPDDKNSFTFESGKCHNFPDTKKKWCEVYSSGTCSITVGWNNPEWDKTADPKPSHHDIQSFLTSYSGASSKCAKANLPYSGKTIKPDGSATQDTPFLLCLGASGSDCFLP